MAFAILGLLLGFAAAFDAPPHESSSIFLLPPPSNNTGGTLTPEIQSKLFEDCTKDAKLDGELTEDEYYRCAYSIYS